MAVEHMKTWRVGAVEITRIVEVWRLEDDFFMLFEGADNTVGAPFDWLRPHHLTDAGQMIINFQGFAVKTPDRTIIVDTCIGANRDREYEVFCNLQSKFMEDLASIDILPADVDTVLCTHLHFDHVGWNTHFVDGQWRPAFPNARYLLGRKEYKHWMMLRETGGYHDVRHLSECVDPIVEMGLADFVEPGHQVCDEISLIPTPGHTPGHVSVWISSEGEEAVITGDLMHHPIQIGMPTRPGNFDMEKAVGAEQRVKMIERCKDKPVLMIGSHFADPTAGWVVSDGDGAMFKSKV